jgi:hypothetical protein
MLVTGLAKRLEKKISRRRRCDIRLQDGMLEAGIPTNSSRRKERLLST